MRPRLGFGATSGRRKTAELLSLLSGPHGPGHTSFLGREIRAMDRRRYVPSAEGLEGRALLSFFKPTQPATSFNPVVDLPNTPEQKALRIQRLPFFLSN